MRYSPPRDAATPVMADLECALERVQIASSEDVRVDGIVVPEMEAVVPVLTRALPGFDPLIYRIQYALYAQLYARARPRPDLPPQAEPCAELLAALEEIQRARLCATKGAALDRDSGNFVVHGETAEGWASERPLVRLYWNLPAAGAAPPLFDLLLGLLDSFRVPFQLKCLVDPQHYDRLDTAVLYCEKQHFQIVAQLVVQVVESPRVRLLAPTPLLTKALRPGLALAEDPGRGLSFGLSRCLLLAEAVAALHHRDLDSGRARAAAVADLCRGRGLDPGRLYLNAGSVDHYHLPPTVHTGPTEVAA